MLKQLFSKASWSKARTLTATIAAGTGTGGSRPSPLRQKRGSNGEDETLVNESVGELKLKILRETELSVETAERPTSEDDRSVGANGLGAPTGCSYEATCKFSSTSSSASSSRTASGEMGEV